MDPPISLASTTEDTILLMERPRTEANMSAVLLAYIINLEVAFA